MSHSVTIQTRTVTTGSPSAINTSFFRSWTGILKLAQVVSGLIVMSLLVSAINEQQLFSRDIFLMLMATSFMMGTGIFIISYVFSPISEPIIGKTNYELIYNGLASLLLLIGGIIVVNDASHRLNSELMMAAGVIGIIDAILYTVNFAWAIRLKFVK
ncbi:uncharacterized protein LOC131664446 isoform X2 [Phymastichus coffea]|uniref:uncharacterized protein LOC131664446 isoform X2 n=1 Tax=Phymastichus coffea TaxID=108790 RepID=UPI00273C0719|nr:uncharacterized protein LOC131664446 isoform X2 [Phymastichus coffea]